MEMIEVVSKVSETSVPMTPQTEGEILQSSNVKSFSFSDLKSATRNFRPNSVLEEGGFGSVFKGRIDEHTFAATKSGTGVVIVVKRLNQEGYQGHKEWLVLLSKHLNPVIASAELIIPSSLYFLLMVLLLFSTTFIIVSLMKKTKFSINVG